MRLTDMQDQQEKLVFVWQHQDLEQQTLLQVLPQHIWIQYHLLQLQQMLQSQDLGKDSFQEIDIVGATMPITKHNFIVKEIENLAPYN